MKYRTVVIDPPWDIRCALKNEKYYRIGRPLPYSTMTDAEIEAFPIDNFADVQCDLFMWTTHSKLPIALEILQAWGFKYHALITWDKMSGICLVGFYRRTEFAVYGYRGKQGVNVNKGSYIPTIFKAKTKRHSEKPAKFYDILRQRTQEPRIDIFARRKHYGFDAWGNEVQEQQTILLEERGRVHVYPTTEVEKE